MPKTARNNAITHTSTHHMVPMKAARIHSTVCAYAQRGNAILKDTYTHRVSKLKTLNHNNFLLAKIAAPTKIEIAACGGLKWKKKWNLN